MYRHRWNWVIAINIAGHWRSLTNISRHKSPQVIRRLLPHLREKWEDICTLLPLHIIPVEVLPSPCIIQRGEAKEVLFSASPCTVTTYELKDGCQEHLKVTYRKGSQCKTCVSTLKGPSLQRGTITCSGRGRGDECVVAAEDPETPFVVEEGMRLCLGSSVGRAGPDNIEKVEQVWRQSLGKRPPTGHMVGGAGRGRIK